MNYQNPQLMLEPGSIPGGAVRWRSPSNIAIVKYWGKHGVQLPRNPSFSFTLDSAATDTRVAYGPKQNHGATIDLQFRFAGEERPDFADRVSRFLESLLPVYPFLRQLQLQVETDNSFPHSAGIASSASAMSALALCLVDIERILFGQPEDQADFNRKASYLARLGSGSASRSIYGQSAIWGQTGEVEESSDEYAIPSAELTHPVFHTFHDDILLISRSEKSVSSRAGHGLMENNIYADNRYAQARQRMHELLRALRTGDLEKFGEICESEALTLHALMMTSSPPYLLMEPNTLAAIRSIQAYRRDTGHPVYFTLDAGPNIHLLYPGDLYPEVRQYVRQELLPLCADQQYIADKVGTGPLKLETE